MRKFFKILFSIFVSIYLVIVIFLTICVLNYNDYNLIELDNNTFIAIDDNALSPNYKKGDLVIVKGSDRSKIKEGDLIFFYDTYQEDPYLNLSKVTIIDDNDNITVEGDKIIYQEHLIGKTSSSTKIEFIGLIFDFVTSQIGYLLVVVLPVLFMFLYEVYVIIMEIKKTSQNKTK